MSKLEAALSLASQGFLVFPLFPNRKTPAITQWQKQATTDPEKIKEFWSGSFQVINSKGKSWVVPSDANIGIHTKNLVVIDVDVKDPENNGAESIKQFPPCKTRISRTATGGLHILFRSSDKSIQNMTALRPGIDIRTTGGFIVAPGSTVDGSAYEWLNNADIAPLPDAIASIIKGGVVKQDLNENFGEVRNDFSNIPDIVRIGERDRTFFGFACSWRERGFNKAQALILLKELFSKTETSESDPFTWDDAVAKLEHAWDSYKPGGIKDPAVTTKPTVELKTSRAAASLQDAVNYFVFIEEGSRVADTRRHPTCAVMQMKDFTNSMKPDKIDGTDVVNLWMRSPHRQTVRDVGYFPQENLPIYEMNGQTFFNSYYGPNLVLPETPDPNLVQLFDDHLRYLYPDPRSYNLMLDWMAFTVQYPHERIPWCFLTISIHEGIGKGLLYTLMSKCVGEHNSSLVQPDELSESGGTYNGYLSGKTLVCWDEIKTKSTDHERLRLLITSPQLQINHKYGSKKNENIYANTMAFSNHMNAIRISESDRRFFVECNYEPPRNRFYYDRLWSAVNGDLPAHWLKMLKMRDVSMFAWSSSPADTEAKKLMKYSSEDPMVTLIKDCIEEGIGPMACDIVDSKIIRTYLERIGPEYGVILDSGSERKISNILSSVCGPLPHQKYPIPTGKKSGTLSRVRCKCIRRYQFWQQQTVEAVGSEYLRAKMMAEKNITRDDAAEEVRRMIGA